MIRYAIYLKATGAIIQQGTCQAAVLDKQSPTNSVNALIQLPDVAGEYYVDVAPDPPVVIAKIALPYTINKTTIIADEVDEITIIGLPNPSTVKWPDDEITIETDGEASFTLDLAGGYTIEISSLHYIKEVINVTATTPA